jgi:cell wall-associated NlpC family hydrolase
MGDGTKGKGMTTPQDFGARAAGGYGGGSGDVAFLGANQLSSHLTSLERAVSANTKSIKDLTTKFAEYSKTAGGTHVKAQGGQGFAGVINNMTQYTGKHAGGYTPRHGQAQGFPSVINNMTTYTPRHGGAGAAGPGMTGAPPAGGGGGTTAVMPAAGATGGPSAGGRAISTFKGMATSAAFTLGGLAMGVGKAEFPKMLTMSNYIQQTTLGTSMSNQAANAMARRQLTGTAVGTSLQDVAAGQQMLQRMGGTVNLGSTPGSQAGVSTANALGYTNPGIGLTGAAQTTAAIFNPSTSIRATMMGLPSPFGGLGPNRKPQGITGLINQLETGGRTSKQTTKPWTPEQVTSALTIGPGGVGGLYQTLSTVYGLTPDQIGQVEQVAQGMAKLQQKGPKGQAPLSAQQAQALMNKAAGGNKQAQQQLNARGVNQTMQQIQQNLGQQQNQITGNMYNNFNQGLSKAADLLGEFNKVLEKMAGMPGVGQAAGFSGQVEHALGIGGSSGGLLGSLAGGAELGIGSVLGKKALGKFGGKLGGKAGSKILSGAGKSGIANRIGKGLLPLLAERIGLGALPSPTKKAEADYQKSIPKKGIGKDIYGIGADIFGAEGLDKVGGWLAEARGALGIGNLFAEGTHPTGHPAGRGGGAATPTSPKSKQKVDTKKKAKTSKVSGAAGNAVGIAEKYVGTPYVYGGDSPSAGFDCSGLIEYAYKQAGIALPRTSQAQWAFLSKKAIDLKKVQEGDIVFGAGSDGSPNSPGHEALMISQRQIIEAPYTGANIRIRAYNPGEWSHAGRPTGSLSGSSTQSGAGAVAGTGKAPNAKGSGTGNTGTSISSVSPVGNYGSVEEIEGLTAALAGGGMGGGYTGITGSSSAGTPGTKDASNAASGKPGKPGQTTSNLSGNKQILNKAASKYGWGTGAEWAALDKLEMHEAGYNSKAQNPTSTAYGMGQFLDNTWSSVGGSKTDDPTLQAQYMMKYIKQRYGDPIKAWGQYFGHAGGVGWYAAGGKDTPEGMKVVGERGPELIKTPKGTDILSNKQSMELLKSVKRPAETAHSTLLQDIAHGLKSVEKAAAGTLSQSQSANLASITASPSTTSYHNAARNLVLSTSTNVQRYGGGGGYGSAPSLNFKPNSIVIHNHSNSSGNGGASGDQQASLNAREMVKQVLRYLYNEQMYGAMAKGVKA